MLIPVIFWYMYLLSISFYYHGLSQQVVLTCRDGRSDAEKVLIFNLFEQGYVIIIIVNYVSLYFKSHLEVK